MDRIKLLLILGTEIGKGSPVALSSNDRKQGTYVAGVNNTGKTILWMNTSLSAV